MKYNLIIKEEARNEIQDAFIWYNEQRHNLGNDFIITLEYYFSVIILNPFIYAEKYKNMRAAVMHKFPFLIVFEIEEKNIIVYSVFHTSRKPKSFSKTKK
jgi:hypothetical protein